MGIIVGFFALIFAAGALVLAWPLGWWIGGYRRAAALLAVLLCLAGFAIAALQPMESGRPETALWPFGVGGGGVIVLALLFYYWVFATLWRWGKRLAGI
jgi:peptidoglycan/LPS O-acetylase OafA/YrhL